MNPICTWMYTPASKAERLEKALYRGADAVIYDLEDAVAPDRKGYARDALREFLTGVTPRADASRIYVRINEPASPWFADDLGGLSEVPHIEGIRVPKVDTPAVLERVAAVLPGKPLHALAETPLAVARLEALAGSPRVHTIGLGDNDLRVALRLHSDEALQHLRVRLVVALAAAGKQAPAGSVYPRIHDLEGLLEDTRRLRSIGFFGRSVLHPAQLEAVRAGFAPSAEEVEWALAVVEADKAAAARGDGAVMLENGQFVDKPFVERAREILAQARR